MPDSESDTTDAPIASKLQEMRSGDDPSTPAAVEDSPYAMATLPSEGASWGSKGTGMGTGTSQPSAKSKSNSTTSTPSSNDEEILGGDITVKLEPGEAPKLSRTASQKVPAKPRQLFSDSPDKTDEALGTFDVLPQCSYVPKYLGESEPALDCDCTEEWHPTHGVNFACGEDSDCINRATKMECAMDCGCGSNCQNQRFQRKQYAKVSVIKTEKKGFGLRAETALRPSDFVFEYIGEVINEAAFRKRMIQYDEEGIKHFYFMSLNKGEFIDATKKGNLGRFCNHSCNPNCYVDKWVVGDKLRMGIFAQRHIEAGEELVFNYNVDRYGADPQPCYCGELNCTGFIGGKTQTERATKLSNITIEALGIDDGEGWDVAVAKRPRKKKSSEDDEEYVNNIQPKPLQEAGVTRVMAALRQCKDKWIAVKLLDRIQKSQDSKVMDRVVRMHGYQILKSTLSTWIDDHNVVVQVLDILDTLPRITRNKIQDSKIEDIIQKLVHCGEDRVEVRAKSLLDIWSKLEVGYRIPRVKRDPNAKPAKSERSERRDTSARPNSRSRSRSKTPPKGPAAGVPSGPRGYNGPKFNGPHRMPYRRPHQNLPAGWSSAVSAEGRTYYYNATGERTWVRPTAPIQQAPPPPKEKTNEEKLQDIIRSITENPVLRDKQPSSATTPVSAPEPKKEKNEKWRRYTQEKQMKIYENTLFPHIKHVMNKFTHKLPRDDLKRFAKEVSKKLVESDYKKGRVSDPTIITDKQASAVKRYTQDYLEKAVRKKIEHDKKKASQNQDKVAASASPASASSFSPGNKRKREESLLDGTPLEDDNPEDMSNFKKIKSEPDTPSPPPPPPPPPPADDMDELVDQEGEDGDDPMDESGLSPAGDEDDEPVAFPGVSSKLVDHHIVPSPQQLATPPTTTNGSCENDVESSMEDK